MMAIATMRRGLAAVTGLGLAGMVAAPAFAQDVLGDLPVIGKPVNGGMGFQPASSPLAHDQQWLDHFFGFFEKTVNEEVEYMVGEGTVIARWLATCTYEGVQCPPVRINMHFQFENGLIARIVDDYDTHTGSVEVSKAKAKAHLQDENPTDDSGE
jgi:hypothetical protein